MTEVLGCLWFSVLSVMVTCFIHPVAAAELLSRQNPCLAYATCVRPAFIPSIRVITALFSFNFFRFTDSDFLTEVCHEMETVSPCQNLLQRCVDENWPQATHFQNSDVALAQWVCQNREGFESHSQCWSGDFLTEMTSCTGLERLLEPADCLVNKIQHLQNCTPEAADFFQELLNAAHSS